jgi:hypothetical protein
MSTTTINDELHALRHLRLADVALAMTNLQCLGFVTSEGAFLTMSDGVDACPIGRPYAFYHSQDRDRAIETGRLHIAFGPARTPRQHLSAEILNRGFNLPEPTGRAVLQVLSNSVKAEWNGNPDDRIVVLLDEEPSR